MLNLTEEERKELDRNVRAVDSFYATLAEHLTDAGNHWATVCKGPRTKEPHLPVPVTGGQLMAWHAGYGHTPKWLSTVLLRALVQSLEDAWEQRREDPLNLYREAQLDEDERVLYGEEEEGGADNLLPFVLR